MSRRRVTSTVAGVILLGLIAALAITLNQWWSSERAIKALTTPVANLPQVFSKPPDRDTTFTATAPTRSPAWASDPRAAALGRRVAFARRVMLTDGYEKAGRRDPQWDQEARSLIAAQIAAMCDDPLMAGDDRQLRADALASLKGSIRDDLLVRYIAGRRFALAREPTPEIANHVGAARACAWQTGYPAYVRALALFRGAACAARAARADPDKDLAQFATGAKEFADRGMALLPEVFADPDVPTEFVSLLFETIGEASVELEKDRRTLLTKAAKVADQGRVAKAAVMAATGRQFINYAWDARGSGWASEVSQEGFLEFRRRLDVAKVALERAWALDPKDAFAAKAMITVCTGLGAPREEMETWYRRAVELDPYDLDAVANKLMYLEPKWHGSADELLAFGRELLKAGRWETGQPLAMVDAHFRLAEYVRLPEGSTLGAMWAAYFKANPDAWPDVKAAFDGYLRQFPGSRYHRTRYACVAAWSEQWDEAHRQFELLNPTPSTTFTDVEQYRNLKRLAAARLKAK